MKVLSFQVVVPNAKMMIANACAEAGLLVSVAATCRLRSEEVACVLHRFLLLLHHSLCLSVYAAWVVASCSHT